MAIFRALPGPMAVRDVQDLMAYPFFSLAKSKRVQPIDFQAGGMFLRVEATVEHGLATIWDADVLIWAASQLVEARDAGVSTSRLMQATPYQILTFIGRGTSLRDYLRLKAALDRLQSTTVATSIRQRTGRRLHRFSWINEWKERISARGAPLGIELILPDWFYAGVSDETLVLNIDPRLLPPHRRHRALALSPGAQARRLAAGRLALRLSTPVQQVGQPGAVLRLRARPAQHRGAAVAAWLSPLRHPLAEGPDVLAFRPTYADVADGADSAAQQAGDKL